MDEKNRTPLRRILLALLIAVCATIAAVAVGSSNTARADEADLAGLGWIWPLERFRLEAPYVAPAHEYGPGHRGVDLQPLQEGAAILRSPADGVVAFAGQVAGRGIVTVDHGGGLVTTLEPVDPLVVAGNAVRRGETLATLGLGGHTRPGSVHFGVRRDGKYINPLLLLGGVPRAILLPCCDALG